MKTYNDFMGIAFANWLLFRMLIQIYGEDKLIEVLMEIKENGGVSNIRTIG